MHVILMGPQGPGKERRASVCERLNLGSIATGELFRAAIKGGLTSVKKYKPSTIAGNWSRMT